MPAINFGRITSHIKTDLTFVMIYSFHGNQRILFKSLYEKGRPDFKINQDYLVAKLSLFFELSL